MAKPTPIFPGKYSHGVLVLDDPRRFNAYLASEFKNDARVDIVIQKPEKSRSTSQNAYYWGVVVEILSNHTGNSPKNQAMDLRWRFLTRMDNKGRLYPESTAELSTKEFEEYLEKIRQWASDPDEGVNCYIPLPNEVKPTGKIFVQE